MVLVEAVREGDDEHYLRAGEMEIAVLLQYRKTRFHWNQSIILQLVVSKGKTRDSQNYRFFNASLAYLLLSDQYCLSGFQ